MCAPALREASHELERAAKAMDTDRSWATFAVVETTMVETLAAMRSRVEGFKG